MIRFVLSRIIKLKLTLLAFVLAVCAAASATAAVLYMLDATVFDCSGIW